MITEQNLLTVKQAAERLGVNRQRVLQLINAERLPARKVGSYYTILESDVEVLNDTTRKAGRPKKIETGDDLAQAISPTAKPFKTIFDIAPEVIGSIQSGLPSDLSSNKSYLADLGRKDLKRKGSPENE